MKCVSVYQNDIISSEIAKKICEDLQKDRAEMISFRNCKFSDKDFKRVMKAVGACTSLALRHLVLNVDIIQDSFRIQTLANAIEKNASLVGLHLHGNNIQDSGFKILYTQLKRHPRITSLDLGDCNIGDNGLEILCNIVKESKDSICLHSLVLSHNPKITSDGWTKFGLALASGSCLRSLEIDYNDIGDIVATCIAIALPGVPLLETLDLECTGITDKTGQVLLHLIKSSNRKLKEINLDKNKVADTTKDAINYHLFERSVDKKQKQTSEDECSLAMSEPPLSEEVALGVDDLGIRSKSLTDPSGNISHTESFDNDEIPTVEVIPANKEDTRIQNEEKIEETVTNSATQSLEGFDTNQANINAAGFEIKKAFSTNGTTDPQDMDGEESNKTNSFDEYEAYIPEKESLKHRESSSTLVESMDIENGLENDDLKCLSESSDSVKGFKETDNTPKSVIPAPLFFTRRMSAPMSGNDTVNVETGLVQAKSTNTSEKAGKQRPKNDLASLIRQKNIGTNNGGDEESKKKNDMEVQDLN